jgi:uncharacterized DUF497 family protein
MPARPIRIAQGGESPSAGRDPPRKRRIGLDRENIRYYTKSMELEFDPRKRQWTLEKRSLDFLDASIVLEGRNVTYRDDRRNYGEVRNLTFGKLGNLMIVLVWTGRIVGDKVVCRVISMRRANEREIARYSERLG